MRSEPLTTVAVGRPVPLAEGVGKLGPRANPVLAVDAGEVDLVTGLDLAPVLVETARERATALGLEIDYVVGDAEGLSFADGSFDKVSSTCGVMFAPDHEAAAGELARVTRPGGTIALANWTPTGGLARMFKVMAPYLPSPPPSSPFDWGDEKRVRELLGESFELTLEEHVSTLRLPSGEDYWDRSRPRTGRRRASPSRSGSVASSSGTTGSSSSRRTTAATARSSTPASTCSCWGRADDPTNGGGAGPTLVVAGEA